LDASPKILIPAVVPEDQKAQELQEESDNPQPFRLRLEPTEQFGESK
jgi:hypothetical protein